MNRLTKVFLADLRHDYQGYLTSDAMPLGIGYMKAVMDAKFDIVDSRLFVYPRLLEEALQESVPDVFVATNYVWNESLNQHFAQVIKQLNPNCLVIIGGPNIPLEDDRKVNYVEERPFLDLYVTGEGDFYASELIGSFIDGNYDIEAFLANDWHSAVYRNSLKKLVEVTSIRPRSKDLDEIPSPWLTGVMDQFFDGKLAPLFETNRGCPFTCTFCVQGTKWYTKVNYFSIDRIKKELDYTGQMISSNCPEQKVLRVADPNFGMYERDVEISEHIGKVQVQHNWPLLIDATTGKNRADRIIRSIEKVNGALMMYQAVQSLDEEVLENVKRQNIKLETYEEIQVHIRGRGLRSSSDLILGLPGETLESHINSLSKLIDSGTHRLNNFQSMMLKGSELETMEERKKFGFQTKFRLVPKNFGEYFGKKVFDSEEIIVSTDKLPFDDYLIARTLHLAINLFWNESRFDEIVEFCKKIGITPWTWLESMVETFSDTSGFPELLQLKADFIVETKGELFDSKEQVKAFYSQPQTFKKLIANEIGDNLVYKYRAAGSFVYWKEICGAVFQQTKGLCKNHIDGAEMSEYNFFWKDVELFYTHRFAHGLTAAELLDDSYAKLSYDIGKWLAEDCPLDFEKFRLRSPTAFVFFLPEDQKKNIKGAIDIWSLNDRSMSMLVRRIHHDWRNKSWERIPIPASQP